MIVEEVDGAQSIRWEWNNDGLCAVVLMSSVYTLPGLPSLWNEMRVIGRVSTPRTLASLRRVEGVQ